MEDSNLRFKHFHEALRKNVIAAKGGRRDEIDVLRTAFWYAEIRTRLNASTAYEVERLLEPEAFGKNKDGDHIHRNKWPKYEVGQHVPIDSLVTRVDTILPGTKRILNHILWEALRVKHPINGRADDWLRQLGPDIQGAVFQTQRYGTSNSHHRTSSSRRQLLLIERRAGIDALACLTILLRESCEQDENPHSLEIGKSIYRMLLVLCNTSQFCIFSQELFYVYRNRVFSLPRHKDVIFRLDSFDFIEAVNLLTCFVSQVKDISKICHDRQRLLKVVCKLLDGGYGFDAKFALDPPIGPSAPLSDSNRKDWEFFATQERFRQWGKEQMFLSKREVLPPAELWRPVLPI